MIQEKDYVLWGTGRIARQFYRKYCQERGVLWKPMFWCDSNPALHGTELDGVEVISPDAFFRLDEECYRKDQPLALLVAAMGVNLLQIVSLLEKMVVKAHVYSAVQLDAATYFREQAKAVEEICGWLEDEKSGRLYRALIENMRHGRYVDFSLAEPNQYFCNDVVPALSGDDVLVDAGACQGEEIDKAIAMAPEISVHAFEPDAASFRELSAKYREHGNVILHSQALWSRRETMHFQASGIPSASRLDKDTGKGDSGQQLVECVPLDEALQGERVTFIKMDIEGAEYSALQGAEKTIRDQRPKLAICVYHNLEDYIRIPRLVHAMVPDYRLRFRQHSVSSGESVLYAT